MKLIRKYKGKDVEMLLAITIIINAAITHKNFLQSKRATWADPYFQNILTEIDQIIQQYLGKDNAKELRNATQNVRAIQIPAIKDIIELKIQIDADFTSNPTLKNEILTTLGFKTSYPKAKKYNQEALIELLYQFNKNLTPDLTTTITTKGTDPLLLNKISTYATQLKDKNVLQENKKGTKKEATQQALIAFNTIYLKVIAIAKIATNLLKENPSAKEQFNYAKVLSNLNNN